MVLANKITPLYDVAQAITPLPQPAYLVQKGQRQREFARYAWHQPHIHLFVSDLCGGDAAPVLRLMASGILPDQHFILWQPRLKMNGFFLQLETSALRLSRYCPWMHEINFLYHDIDQIEEIYWFCGLNLRTKKLKGKHER